MTNIQSLSFIRAAALTPGQAPGDGAPLTTAIGGPRLTVFLCPPTSTERGRLPGRRGEISRINGAVQQCLREVAGRCWPAGGWGVTLSVEDQPGGASAGRWTLFQVTAEAGAWCVESYTISPRFDDRDRLAGFIVAGEAEVTVETADTWALAATLAGTRPQRRPAGRGRSEVTLTLG